MFLCFQTADDELYNACIDCPQNCAQISFRSRAGLCPNSGCCILIPFTGVRSADATRPTVTKTTGIGVKLALVEATLTVITYNYLFHFNLLLNF